MYGILHASVATDLKRLLAYSTSENLGLVVAAIGLTMLLRTQHVPGAASAALVAALLLLGSHAAFKVTLFLGAGAVLRGTGERDLDRMGGLVHTMPWTAATFGIGSLGAAALPVTGGFVAEWALLRVLYDQASLPPSQAAATMGVTRGAVTRLADRLIGKGLIVRAASQEDGRAQTLALTPRGREFTPRLAALADRNEAECFDHLTEADRATLERILRQTVTRLGLTAMPLE